MTPLILDWPSIESALAEVDLLQVMERGFSAYSAGDAVIPPVGELQLQEPPGDDHIKNGYIRGGAHYVVKIASGFYDNPALGLPSSQGVMLLFSQTTGTLEAVLLDEGRLTDIRTGAAGAVAARHLAPADVDMIGVIGTGIQARRQLEQLRSVTTCRNVVVWGRNEDHLASYTVDLEEMGFVVERAACPMDVAMRARLIVTTTPSTQPLILADWIQPGTHVTAVGSDTAEKQELDVNLLARADVLVADSKTQCLTRGEIHQALAAGVIDETHVFELGAVIMDSTLGRTNEDQITIADLTGVAVQDLETATAVVSAHKRAV